MQDAVLRRQWLRWLTEHGDAYEYDATVGPTVERVVVAVKDKQRLEAGEEMRVAYGWTEFRVQSLFELTKQQTD